MNGQCPRWQGGRSSRNGKASLVTRTVRTCLPVQETWVPSLGREDALEENLPASAGDLGSIPGSGRCPGGGHGNPLQYSCLEFHGQRAWWATVHGVTKKLGMTLVN